MSLYQTIFTRRSVRKYDMNPLELKEIRELKAYLNTIQQLEGASAKFEFVSGDKVSDGKAPNYVLAFCKPTAENYINVGYTLQEFDLYLQSLGYGTCWLGIPKPKEREDDFCIMLCFGKTTEPKRKGEADFSRLPIDKISNKDNSVARACRLSPSAVNDQPWFLTFYDNKLNIDYAGKGVLKVVLKKKMSKIDIGIVTKIAKIALENEGKTIKSIKPTFDSNMFGTEIVFE